MEKEEREAILESVKSQVSDLTKGFASDDDVTSKIDDLNKSVEALQGDSEAIKALEKVIEDQGLEIKKLSKPEASKGIKGVFEKAFKREGLTGELKEILSSGAGFIELVGTTKAVGTITTGNVSTDTGGNALLDMINSDEINSMRLRNTWIDEFATVTRSGKPVYTYTDYIPKEGDAGFVGEGGLKPEVDLQVAVRTVQPKKAAAHSELSEEAIDDVPRMESESRTHIMKRVLLKRQNGILFGDGLGNNPEGVTTIASAFNPATWTAGQEAAGSTNLKDWVVAAANQIQNAENYADDVDYFPNVAFVNPSDYNGLLVKKASTQGRYMFMNIELGSDRQTLGQVAIIAKKEIPSGNLLIGDFARLNIINYIDYFNRVGYINDQLINNLFTMLGETRFYTLVKELDKIAFVYDTFANIQAGIELP